MVRAGPGGALFLGVIPFISALKTEAGVGIHVLEKLSRAFLASIIGNLFEPGKNMGIQMAMSRLQEAMLNLRRYFGIGTLAGTR